VKYRKQSGYLGLAVAALAALAACSGKDSRAGKPDIAEQKKLALFLQRQIASIAGQANQAAPAAVDPDTRLDGAKAGPGLKLTTMYTLVNAEANGVTTETFETKLAPVVKQGSCENTELRPLIDKGVVVVLEYRGLKGNPLGTVSVNRDTCAKPK